MEQDIRGRLETVLRRASDIARAEREYLGKEIAQESVRIEDVHDKYTLFGIVHEASIMLQMTLEKVQSVDEFASVASEYGSDRMMPMPIQAAYSRFIEGVLAACEGPVLISEYLLAPRPAA